MSKEIVARYDKRLKKYHIEYHTLRDKKPFRYEIFKKLNDQYELAVLIETHLGSVSKPEVKAYARMMEGLFAKHRLRYQVRPIEVQAPKQFFRLLNGGKKTETHYAITFIISKDAVTETLFDDLLCEFDLQIGYDLLKEVDVFFDDMMKGYLDNVFDEGYFGNSFYDSRIFDKFLATEDILSK